MDAHRMTSDWMTTGTAAFDATASGSYTLPASRRDEISGRSNKWVDVTDGDGTTHRFTGTTGADGVTRWTEPPGVNLYLRSLPDGDPKGRWAFTRPDKVTFYFDADGFPTLVDDRNGNRITYVMEDTPPGEDPGRPKKRVTAVTDPGGRSFTLDYWSKDEAKKAHFRGKIQTIADHTGPGPHPADEHDAGVVAGRIAHTAAEHDTTGAAQRRRMGQAFRR
jgi:hypothetical protein